MRLVPFALRVGPLVGLPAPAPALLASTNTESEELSGHAVVARPHLRHEQVVDRLGRNLAEQYALHDGRDLDAVESELAQHRRPRTLR